MIAGALALMIFAPAAPAATINVEMRDDAFVPRDVTIAVADTIVWRNTGANIHTATAANGMFNSGDVPPGGTFQFQFNNVAPGTYIYYCIYHGTPTGQGMAGTITVQGTGPTTSSTSTTSTTRPTTTTSTSTTTTTSTSTTSTTRPATTTTPTTTAPTTTTLPSTSTTSSSTTLPPTSTTSTSVPAMTTTTVGTPTTTTTIPAPSTGTTCDQLRRLRAAFNARIDRDQQAAAARLSGAAEARALARLEEARRQGNASFDRRLAQCQGSPARGGLGSFVSARALVDGS